MRIKNHALKGLFTMKKLLSILCVVAIAASMIAVSAVSASAEVNAAKTALDVKAGDEVVYSLHLSDVANPIIGCDFSFYYEPGVFEVSKITDFEENDNTAQSLATINPKLEGEVRGNWSILRGLDFSKERNFITITYKALKDADNTHLSYFIRYMYDETLFDDPDNKPQITDYKFTCTVTKNGEKVLEKAPAELNVEETQNTGLFVNSVTGDSKDADPAIPNTVGKKSSTASNNKSGSNGTPANQGANNNQNQNNNNANNSSKTTVETRVVDMGKTADGYYITATDAEGNVIATADQAPVIAVEVPAEQKSTSPVVWIIIALVVLAGGGGAAYYFMKKKNGTPAPENKDDNSNNL